MELLIQIVLVSLILIPIVLLLCFAGCGFDGFATRLPPDPTDFVATATGTHSIRVTWQEHVGLTLYDIARVKLGGSRFDRLGDTLAVRESFDDDSTLPGEPLADGTTYLYQLRQPGSDVVLADGATATTIPEAPSLDRLKLDIDQITIRWKNNSTRADRFILRHRLIPAAGPAGSFTDLPAPGPIDPMTQTVEFPHSGLTEGSEHEYQVIATVVGFDQNVSKTVQSAPLTVRATTLKWKPCYAVNPLTQVAGLDFRNACMVQRFKGAVVDPMTGARTLLNSGVKVRITLRAAQTLPIAIARMSISQANRNFAANSPDNEWDSEGSNTTPVLLEGTPPPQQLAGGGILLAAGASILLNPVDYDLNQNDDLIIAFDIANDAGTSDFASVPGSNLFFKPGTVVAPTTEAIQANRTSGPPPGQDYGRRADRVYLVEQIDVLG